MINLILTLAVASFVTYVGIVAISALRLYKIRNIELLSPLIGVCIITAIAQTANVFFPIRVITPFFCLLLIALSLLFHKDIVNEFVDFFQWWWYLLAVLVIVVIYSIPLLYKNQLQSIQYFNNDIIYYLSSMGWLKDHTVLEKVEYNQHHMFNWCANYMLDRTRIGLDEFGAFMMSLFHLEAHQIFSNIGLVLIGIAAFTFSFLEETNFHHGKIRKILLLLVFNLAVGWSELFELQYLPQIFGITCLLLLVCLYGTLQNNSNLNKSAVNLFSIVTSGLISIYAEFTVYIVGFYLIAIITKWIRYRHGRDIIQNTVKYILSSIFWNIPGFIRCLKINFFVFANVGGDQANIDPYNGVLMSIPNVMAKVLGMSLINLYRSRLQTALSAVTIIVFILTMLLIAIFIVQQRETLYYWGEILAYVLLLEVYMRVSSYGYGEYKHLLTISAIVIWLILYSLDTIRARAPKKVTVIASELLMLIVSCSAGYRIYKQYFTVPFYYYDNSLMDLKYASKLVPEGESLGLSGTPGSIHGMLYALQDADTTILFNNTSYYPYSELPFSRYRVYEEDITQMEGADVIWNNGRFSIVKNTGLQTSFYTGFHQYDPASGRVWTCDHESTIAVTNYSDSPQRASLSFSTYSIEPKNITVMLDGETISNSISGEQVVTDPFIINPGEIKYIRLYSDGNLDIVDNLTVGVELSNYIMVIYQ